MFILFCSLFFGQSAPSDRWHRYKYRYRYGYRDREIVIYICQVDAFQSSNYSACLGGSVFFSTENEFVDHNALQFEGKFIAFCISYLLLPSQSQHLKTSHIYYLSLCRSGIQDLGASDLGPHSRLQSNHLKALLRKHPLPGSVMCGPWQASGPLWLLAMYLVCGPLLKAAHGMATGFPQSK